MRLSQFPGSVIRAGLAAVLLAGACAQKKADEYVERPVDELYNEGFGFLKDEDFRSATSSFDEVERQHPYSVWATKAQLMAAYAYYRNNDYDDAVLALDRFIQLHPAHRDIPYAHYLKALSFYEQISDVARDQKMTELAMAALKDVMKRFPDSAYAKDSRIKLDLTYDHLAGKEMEIGRYYQTRGHYLAAINRFRTVVDDYQTTTHTPEALHRLAESYLAIGLQEEAAKAGAVLGHNFPNSEWYVDSYGLIEGKVVRQTAEDDKPWYKIW